ncbi:basic salivary proline-rich protein 2-like [Vidua macroura]|uniref:basic salivary proline-rich protein 2-like n=1 Tax=Vidua macroura TaxID=187451 RepID=UPI0023A86D52|nr:basic salivary proline-rich protein 2-like [Vidua macroura]
MAPPPLRESLRSRSRRLPPLPGSASRSRSRSRPRARARRALPPPPRAPAAPDQDRPPRPPPPPSNLPEHRAPPAPDPPSPGNHRRPSPGSTGNPPVPPSHPRDQRVPPAPGSPSPLPGSAGDPPAPIPLSSPSEQQERLSPDSPAVHPPPRFPSRSAPFPSLGSTGDSRAPGRSCPGVGTPTHGDPIRTPRPRRARHGTRSSRDGGPGRDPRMGQILPPTYPWVTPARASTWAAAREEPPEKGTLGVGVPPATGAGMGTQHITVTSGQAATGTSSHGRCRGSRMAGTTQSLRPRCPRALNWPRAPQDTGGSPQDTGGSPQDTGGSPQCPGTPGPHGGIYPMILCRARLRGDISHDPLQTVTEGGYIP